ncbi:hypothetical protein Tco_1363331 [Tanacetum coccineum]
MSLWLAIISDMQPGLQNEESTSPKRRALFLDPEEKSYVYTNDFPSMILEKIICVSQVSMADANINAPEVPIAADSPPTRSDKQILPLDILKNTNFFKAFTASSTIPTMYIQQFWDTIKFEKDKGYSCQLDEQRFYLTKSTLREALQLPQDNNNFTSPPNSNTIISFVNDLGYPNVVRTSSGVVTNDIVNTSSIKVQHLPYEESALGYLKFSFKNTKRVAKYQRYLVREVVSDDEVPATKPAKGAKPKTTRKLICTDIAKITRKRSKPDKHKHGNGKSAQEPGVFYQKIKEKLTHSLMWQRDSKYEAADSAKKTSPYAIIGQSFDSKAWRGKELTHL